MAVSAPLTTPTANVGSQAQGSLLASQMLEIGKKAAALLDPSSPLGQAVLHALKTIGSKVGTAPAGTQVSSLQSQLVEAQRNAMQRLALQHMLSGSANPAPMGAAPAVHPSGAAGAPPAPTPMAA